MGAEAYAHEGLCNALYLKSNAERQIHREELSEKLQEIEISFLERRAKIREGLDFTILGHEVGTWKLCVKDAACSGRILYNCLKVFPRLLDIHIPQEFDILTIDLMVNFLLMGEYVIPEPLRLLRAEAATYDSVNLAQSVHSTTPFVLHFSMYHLGNYMDIPELMGFAFKHIYDLLSSQSSTLSLAGFRELVELAWNVYPNKSTDMDFGFHNSLSRRLTATVGAVMNPLWLCTNYDVWDNLVSLDGEFKSFAKCQAEAIRYVGHKSGGRHAHFVAVLLQKHEEDVAKQASCPAKIDKAKAQVESRKKAQEELRKKVQKIKKKENGGEDDED